MYSAFEIANYFIKRANEDNDKDFTLIKLIKLVYIAQGFSLARDNKILFKENVEAWKYGPVIPEIYHELKRFKNNRVSVYLGRSNIAESGEISPKLPNNDNVNNLLCKVWNTFGKYNGLVLSTWTHRENSAWDIAYNQLGGDETSGFVIDPGLIKSEFTSFIKQPSKVEA